MGSRVVQVRVPDEIQEAASAVIEATGLTVSDVVRVLMTRIATDKMLPLDLFQPNAETLEAMRDAREGRTERTTVDNILAEIDEAQASSTENLMVEV